MIVQSNCSNFVKVSNTDSESEPLCHKTVTLIENLENYDKTLDEKIAAIDLYLNYYYVNSEGLTLDISDEYVSNPINVYRMIDRLSHISDMTRKFIDGDAWDKSIRENVNKLVLANKELESELWNMKEEAVRDLDSYLNENEKVENFIEEIVWRITD